MSWKNGLTFNQDPGLEVDECIWFGIERFRVTSRVAVDDGRVRFRFIPAPVLLGIGDQTGEKSFGIFRQQ